MTAQLALDVGDRPGPAAVEAIVLVEHDYLLRHPPKPSDEVNCRSHAELVRGNELLLDWLAARTVLPADPLAWPCRACLVAPGEPCDLVERVDSWTGPLPHYHLARDLTGRWARYVPDGQQEAVSSR